jgi:hypothetical protein
VQRRRQPVRRQRRRLRAAPAVHLRAHPLHRAARLPLRRRRPPCPARRTRRCLQAGHRTHRRPSHQRSGPHQRSRDRFRRRRSHDARI